MDGTCFQPSIHPWNVRRFDALTDGANRRTLRTRRLWLFCCGSRVKAMYEWHTVGIQADTIQWIDLREIQETIDFPLKYGDFPVIFPFNQSIEQWDVPNSDMTTLQWFIKRILINQQQGLHPKNHGVSWIDNSYIYIYLFIDSHTVMTSAWWEPDLPDEDVSYWFMGPSRCLQVIPIVTGILGPWVFSTPLLLEFLTLHTGKPSFVAHDQYPTRF